MHVMSSTSKARLQRLNSCPGSPLQQFASTTTCSTCVLLSRQQRGQTSPLRPGLFPVLQLMTSSASVLLIKDPSVSRWRQPCTAQLSTQSVEKQAKKHLNMETNLSRTNERTAASKLVSPIGRLNSELIFRSHVTGVYRCRAKMSTNHLFFWFAHIMKHLADINIH